MNTRIILSSKQLKVTCKDRNQGDEYNHVDILSTDASEYLMADSIDNEETENYVLGYN
ncbi:MAG: hypothetical protein KC484_03115 [Colwelliaceae bacterium]|nr:hypothetical protein [Colwelliaceae bacterium]